MSIESPVNKAELIETCKVRLGYPVLRIQVHEQQYNVRVREAVNLFTQYHYQATESIIVAQQITQQDIANGYFTPLSDSIVAVTDFLSFRGSWMSHGIIDAAHTSISFMNPFYTMSPGGRSQFDSHQGPMLSMFMVQFGLSNWESISTILPEYSFSPISRRLTIHGGTAGLKAGNYIVYRAHSTLEDIADSPFWGNDWLVRYTTELIKLQWGTNLSKFQEMQMPGGMSFNGKDLASEAEAKIITLREELYNNYTMYPAISIA